MSTAVRLLGDRYALERRLAVGGMGEVWRACDTLLGRTVAIKLPRPEFGSDPEFLDRFRNEARHAAALTHPNVAAVFDFGTDSGAPFLVMALVEGESLAELLGRVGRLRPTVVEGLIRQVGRALQAAHDAGLCHRDVKPGNLIIQPDGTAVVTDFGIARAVDAAAVTQVGLLTGTAQYVSPEQVAGHPGGPASDVYALGVVAYECLAGRRPFEGESLAVLAAHRDAPPPSLPTEVPPALAALVMGLLDKDPARRPTAGQLAAMPDAGLVGPPDGVTMTLALPELTPAIDPGRSPGAPAAPRTTWPARGRTAGHDPRRRAHAVLLMVGAVVVLGALSVVALLGPGGSPHLRHVPAVTAPAPPLRIAGVTLFHPGGSGEDHPVDVGLAADGNPATAWLTQHYASVDFGGLRPGVGLVFDLGRPVPVGSVRVTFATSGAAAEVHAGSALSGLERTPALWRSASVSPVEQVSLTPAVTARYWLVWFTRLPAGSSHQAGVAEAAFRA